MDRLDLLRQTAVGAGSPADASLSPRLMSVTMYHRPFELFQPDEIPAGAVPEYPLSLSFIHKDAERLLVTTIKGHGKKPVTQAEEDYVYVPTYIVGVCGSTPQDAEQNFFNKLNMDAGEVLLAAARTGKRFKPSLFVDLVEKMVNHFNANHVGLVRWKGYLVGVNLDSKDALVRPYRTPYVGFKDTNNKYEPYYGYAEQGLAVLDNTVLAIGKVVDG